MHRRPLILAVAALLAVGIAGGATVTAIPGGSGGSGQDTYDLDMDTDGSGASADGTDAVTAEIDANGQATVQDNDGSNDRTAFTEQPGDVTVYVNTSDEDYEIPVQLGGQGSSYAATGVDGWDLYLQGDTALDGSNDRVQFHGNFTLTGTDDGYAVNGTAILNIPDGQDTNTYRFGVAGSATFGPSD